MTDEWFDRCGFCGAKFKEEPEPDCAFPERHPNRHARIQNNIELGEK